MNQGDIILITFPFSELTQIKVRPAVLINFTNDKYQDLILSAISSVVPSFLTETEIFLYPNNLNNLRTNSIIKVDRIATLKNSSIITKLGSLSIEEFKYFCAIFKSLADK